MNAPQKPTLPADRPALPARRGLFGKRRRILYGVLALLLAGGAYAAWRLYAPANDAGAANLVAQPVVLGDIEETVTALGALQPLEYVDVGAQVSGQLKKIPVAIGDQVRAGDLLVEIDPQVYQAKVDGDEATLVSLKAQIAEKQAARTLAEQQFARQKELKAENATSQDAYDSADALLKSTTAQIASLRAQVMMTESTLKGNRANLQYTKIYAPMGGTVVSQTLRQGQTIVSNQSAPTILRIANLDTMTVWTQVSEADVAKLKLGMPVYFTTLGEPDKRRYGTLRQILPTPDVVNNVVLYNALFDVRNEDRTLQPQMSAQVFFVLADAKDVPLVPVKALRPVDRPPGGGKKKDGGGEQAAQGQKPPAAQGQPAPAEGQAQPQTAQAPAADAAAPDGTETPRIKGKRYMVRVKNGDTIEERKIVVGVSNRLVAEVRDGLKAGDEVLVDTAPASARPGASGQPPAARQPRI
ncbi:MAG: efflux RND transporter periplasmic adaptor subunit [Alphaproteobacteria bacterium]